MEALVEITGAGFHPHTYLLDGTTLIAYIKAGERVPYYFKNGIKGFDRRGRKFQKADTKLFKVEEAKESRVRVEGSKGAVYWVDPEAQTCTCPGFQFRGACKHVKELDAS